jgi:hypothetical protein
MRRTMQDRRPLVRMNLGYYAHDPDRKAWRAQGRPATSASNLASGRPEPRCSTTRAAACAIRRCTTTGRRILFSYRKGGTEQYHLYEIGSTTTARSEIEAAHLRPLRRHRAAYLPDGGIVFVSSRCKRWVNCWLTQVAVLHRCDADGATSAALQQQRARQHPVAAARRAHPLHPLGIRRPQPGRLPPPLGHESGRHLADDWYGNLHPGIVMIDAKPIPGTDRIVASFSPGHGQREHDGAITRPRRPQSGPRREGIPRGHLPQGSTSATPGRSPKTAFMARRPGCRALVIDGAGPSRRSSNCPREDQGAKPGPRTAPLVARPREHRSSGRSKPDAGTTGRLVARRCLRRPQHDGRQARRHQEAARARNAAHADPLHRRHGSDQLRRHVHARARGRHRAGRTRTARPTSNCPRCAASSSSRSTRTTGGETHAELLTVQPGETTSCVGCHEQRTAPLGPPLHPYARRPHARRAVIEPIADACPTCSTSRATCSPILDALCVDCHGYEKTARGGPRAGRLLLTGDHGPMFSHSYYMLTIARLFSDGRNRAVSNYAPRTLGRRPAASPQAARRLALRGPGHPKQRRTAPALDRNRRGRIPAPTPRSAPA